MTDLLRNFIESKVSVAIAPHETVLTVDDPVIFPSDADLTGSDFYCTLLEEDKREIIRLTGATTAPGPSTEVSLHSANQAIKNNPHTGMQKIRVNETALLTAVGFDTSGNGVVGADTQAQAVVFDGAGTLVHVGPLLTVEHAHNSEIGPFSADYVLQANTDYYVGVHWEAECYVAGMSSMVYPHDHVAGDYTVTVTEGYRWVDSTEPTFGTGTFTWDGGWHFYLADPMGGGAAFDMERAREGTQAQSFGIGAVVKHAVTAGILGRLKPSRETATFTTESLAAGAHGTGVIQMAKGYRLLAIQTSAQSRTRLYTTTAKRDADVARAVGVDNPTNSGLMFEYVASAADTYELSPVVDGFQNESTPSGVVPITVTNTGAAPAAITVTLTYVNTES